jgi:hypothetical protein
MSAGNVSRVIRGPGRWVEGPTDLTAAYPYGGVEIGKSRQVVVRNAGRGMRIVSEGLGEGTDVLGQDNRWVVAFFLRGWDDDAVSRLLTDNYVVGPVTGHAMFAVPAASDPGASNLGRARVLLYVPDDLINVPAILIYRGVPDWTEGAEIAFQRKDEIGLPIAVELFRDANNNMLKIGRFADLSLT